MTAPDGNGTDESAEADDGNGSDREDGEYRTHLEDVDDGCGCAEIWEELSERRDGPDDG